MILPGELEFSGWAAVTTVWDLTLGGGGADSYVVDSNGMFMGKNNTKPEISITSTVVATALYVLYGFLVVIILMNMLIAQVSETFEKIVDTFSKQEDLGKTRADIICSYLRRKPNSYKFKAMIVLRKADAEDLKNQNFETIEERILFFQKLVIDADEVDTVWGRLKETKKMTRKAVEATEVKLLEEMKAMKEKVKEDMQSMKQDIIAKLVATLEKDQGKK
eukprot:g5900.t1